MFIIRDVLSGIDAFSGSSRPFTFRVAEYRVEYLSFQDMEQGGVSHVHIYIYIYYSTREES
jgi:hypothetical protein